MLRTGARHAGTYCRGRGAGVTLRGPCSSSLVDRIVSHWRRSKSAWASSPRSSPRRNSTRASPRGSSMAPQPSTGAAGPSTSLALSRTDLLTPCSIGHQIWVRLATAWPSMADADLVRFKVELGLEA
jgi:hypothetical protein